MLYRLSTTLLPGVVLLGCATNSTAPAAGDSHSWGGKVQVHGALRAMLHEGQTGAMVALDTILPNQDLYGLGALAGLAGEITVVGGKAYLSYPEGADAMRTETTFRTNAAATLLVTAEVPAWRDFVLGRPILFEELDEEIGKIAAAAGMSLDVRFPFLLEGVFEDLRWHVIDGSRLSAGGTSHQDHLAAAASASTQRATATLVGFYSKSDQGIFTHMGSRTHIHCVVDEPLSTGHLDHVTVPVGTTIKFPASGDERPNQEMQRNGSAVR